MTEGGLWWAAGLCAALYGLALAGRPPSPPRTLVKTAATAALAALAYLQSAGPWLALALALCAIGDAFLAGDPRRWLPFGLAAFWPDTWFTPCCSGASTARRDRWPGPPRRWSGWPPPPCWPGCGATSAG
jgi:hypothetical protein